MQLLNFENKLKDVKSEEQFQPLLLDLQKTDQYSVSLVPKYNNFLVKGGRLSPQAALLAKLLNIVPIIKFENGELKKEGKGRIFERVV
ncbi:DegV family protein, partial [Mycoplasmopsis synoviae]